MALWKRPLGFTLVLALVIMQASPGVTQTFSPVGRYDMEWAQMDKGLRVDLANGTRRVEIFAVQGNAPAGFDYAMRDATTSEHLWFLRWLGSESYEAWTGGFGVGTFVGPVVGQGMQGFYLEAEVGSGHNPGTYLAVGRRVAATPPPAPPPPAPAPPPAASSITIAVTAPKANAVLSGTGWATVWMNGSSGTGSNTFVLFVDGVERGRTASNSRGPVSLAWNTRAVVNGGHAITVRGTDALGKSGTSAPVSVQVRN